MFIKSIGNTVRLLNKNNGVQKARQRRRKANTTALFLKGYLAPKSERPFHEGQHAVSW